jgi:DUF4097 and DUF4098 domain-containing protein YvlB
MHRSEHHTPGHLAVEVAIAAGRVEVQTAETDQTTVDVTSLSPGDAGVAAAAAAAVDLHEDAGGARLSIDIPRKSRFFVWSDVSLLVRVRCPDGTDVAARTGSADVQVRGAAGSVDVKTASGDVAVSVARGDVEIKTASGAVEVGAARGRATVKTMSGDVVVASAAGPASAHTMSGDVRVEGLLRGAAELRTMSGDIVASVRPGVSVWIDASSKSGRVGSELAVSDSAPAAGTVDLEIRASSMSGDIDLRRAAVAARTA